MKTYNVANGMFQNKINALNIANGIFQNENKEQKVAIWKFQNENNAQNSVTKYGYVSAQNVTPEQKSQIENTQE